MHILNLYNSNVSLTRSRCLVTSGNKPNSIPHVCSFYGDCNAFLFVDEEIEYEEQEIEVTDSKVVFYSSLESFFTFWYFADEESEYEEQEIEVTDSEAENEEEPEENKRKLPRRRDLYTICKDNGKKLLIDFSRGIQSFKGSVTNRF